MSSDETVDVIERIADVRAAERLLREAGHIRIAECLREYLDGLDAGADRSLDETLGLRRHGGVSVPAALALRRRDAGLVHLRMTHPEWSNLSTPAAARRMKISAETYERQRWPRDQEARGGPSAEPSATWFEILSKGLKIPAVKRLQQIIFEAESKKIDI